MNKKCKRLAWSLWFIIYILHSHNLSVQKKKKTPTKGQKWEILAQVVYSFRLLMNIYYWKTSLTLPDVRYQLSIKDFSKISSK